MIGPMVFHIAGQAMHVSDRIGYKLFLLFHVQVTLHRAYSFKDESILEGRKHQSDCANGVWRPFGLSLPAVWLC